MLLSHISPRSIDKIVTFCMGSSLNMFLYLKNVFFLDSNEARLEELARNYLDKQDNMYICTICSRSAKDRYAAKMHLESKHFPTEGAYSCDLCGKYFNTKNAYNTHKSYQH